jgi:hypothetical protein
MEHAHYVVLFAGLIFGKNPAANDRSGVMGVALRFKAFDSVTRGAPLTPCDSLPALCAAQ